MPVSTTHTTSYPSLAGKSVFITGGATGIGEVMVKRFCEQACKSNLCIDIAKEQGEATMCSSVSRSILLMIR